MEHASDPHVRALIATAASLVLAVVFFADMCIAGLAHAAPRDAVTLAGFVLVRWITGRGLRPAPSRESS